MYERKEQRRDKKHFAYLWKTFFVHMVHHHNFIVKRSTAPSRAKQQEQQMRDNLSFLIESETLKR